jgi:hypothetical protein
MIRRPSDTPLPIVNPQGTDKEMLDSLLTATFLFFRDEVNQQTGLTADKTQPHSPSSIAAVGLALCASIVAVERDLLSQAEAVQRTLKVLKFLWSSHQGPEADASGYKGFYYHFLDMKTGQRAWASELSTIDTAILMAGILTASAYFDGEDSDESEIRELAQNIYSRVDWQWALNGGATVCHGWKPESGFLPYRWDDDYSEAHILYILALGSPTFPIDPQGYRQWISTFKSRTLYGYDHLYAGPLFIHQMSQQWLDFRGFHDDFNRKTGVDYFENSRRSTHMQRQYAIENPLQWAHYGENNWGLTASDGPGPATLQLNGVQRTFFDYTARGAPFGPDDGTISPWAVIASLPFAPEIVIPAARHAIERLDLKKHSRYGFDASFNPTFPDTSRNPNGWVSPWVFGLNQGPIILMIENFQTGLIWNLVRKCEPITRGLRQAGFTPAIGIAAEAARGTSSGPRPPDR